MHKYGTRHLVQIGHDGVVCQHGAFGQAGGAAAVGQHARTCRRWTRETPPRRCLCMLEGVSRVCGVVCMCVCIMCDVCVYLCVSLCVSVCMCVWCVVCGEALSLSLSLSPSLCRRCTREMPLSRCLAVCACICMYVCMYVCVCRGGVGACVVCVCLWDAYCSLFCPR